MAQQKSLTVNFFGRDVSLGKALDGIKKNTFATSNVLEQGSKKATYVLGALGLAAAKFAKAAMDDEKGAASLANTLKTVTNASAAQIANVDKYISKAELFSTIADDKLRPAFDTLVRSTGNIGKAQSQLNLAMEIATKTGADVTEVADAMAKASRGQFKALVNLTKIQPHATKATTVYGNQMKVVNGQLITVQKTMGKTQKSTESLEDYLKRVGVAYKGSIAGQSETAAFKLAQFNVAMDHVQETLGAMLLPYIVEFSKWLIKIEPWVEKNKETIKKLALAIAATAVAFKVLNATFKAIQAAKVIAAFLGIGSAAATAGAEGAAAGTAMSLAWAPILATILAVAAGLGLIVYAYKNWKPKKNNANPNSYEKAQADNFLNYAYGAGAAGSPTLSNLNIPHMATGGIVTKPTVALIGEAGPEAVVPLGRGGSGVTIINYIQGSVVTEKELSLKIRNDMAQLLRRKGINPSVLGV